jgi:nucleotide-binding universal stress UspA family protein
MSAEIPRIVVPFDGSPLARRAVHAAGGLARRAGIPITVFGITNDEIERHEVLRAFDDLEPALSSDVSVDVVVDAVGAVVRIPGYVARSIAEEAGRDGALVCMASHGRSGLGAAILGSTTEQVLREATRPVVVVGPHFEGLGSHAPRDGRLVVCLDGSPLSERALGPARDWARQFHTTPWLVQVAQPLGMHAPDLVRYSEAGETNYVRRTSHVVPHSEYDVLHAHDVARELADLPNRWPVDLLVMASHGRSGLSRLTLGSVTMKVVHHAPCPVLVVPPDRTADVAVDEHVAVAQ